MSVKHETSSGLIWIEKVRMVNMLEGSKARMRFAEIQQLPQSGLFAAELALKAPDIQAITISVESPIDLTGIESLPLLSWIIVHECGGILPYNKLPGEDLNLSRLVMPYVPEVTEQLVASPHLLDLELNGGSFEVLKRMSGSVRKVRLERSKGSTDGASWNCLAQLEDIEINQSGTIEVATPEGGWPELVSFTAIGSLKGLVSASKIRPFRGLYLEGIRLLDSNWSIWDLEAQNAFIGFSSKPPKWLVEAWPRRPADWASILKVSYHSLLPGSEDQNFDEH